MTPIWALIRKEVASLFGAPAAYLTLTGVALVSALIFFDHLRVYNQILFLYASSTVGGFETGTVPEYVNLWDTVFFPVMEALGLTLIGAVPLLTMRAFADERARGTDELLLTSSLSPGQIVVAKFAVAYAFVALTMVVSFVYPAAAIERGGLGAQHLAAVFLGLLLHGMALASIGMACSAFTSSPLTAAVSAWALATALWDVAWIAPFVNEPVAAVLEGVALRPRYGNMAEGFVAIADVAYCFGIAIVAMSLARLSFDLRRAG